MSRSSDVPKQPKRSPQRRKLPQRRRNVALWWGLGAIAGIAILAALFAAASSSRNAAPSSTTREVAPACTTDMATQFHIHPHLTIIINERSQVIPPNIAITATCPSALHPHDTSGIIHVESPIRLDFTLGDFFAVWHQPFNQNQILDYKALSKRYCTMGIRS